MEPIGWTVDEGIITISTRADLKKTTGSRIYDIRDLLVQAPDFEDAPAFDLNSALQNTNSGGSGGGGGSQSLFSGGGDEGDELRSRRRESGRLPTDLRRPVQRVREALQAGDQPEAHGQQHGGRRENHDQGTHDGGA